MIRDEYGKWLNTSVFRQEAIRFENKGYYTPALKGTPDWFNYWIKQYDYVKNGFEYEGEKITGLHYFYLNFTKIYALKKTSNRRGAGVKILKSPDFWDGDYDYFWALEIARNGIATEKTQVPSTKEERKIWNELNSKLSLLLEKDINAAKSDEYKEIKEKRDELSLKILSRLKLRVKPHLDWLDGGHHLIVGKRRRGGYSYKNAAIGLATVLTIRKAGVIYAAYLKEYLEGEGVVTKFNDMLDFIDEYVDGFEKKRQLKNTSMHKKFSYKDNDVEKGYKSWMRGLTFNENPDVGRGKDVYYFFFEEAGKFPKLIESYNATLPALEDGAYTTGQAVLFGTSGSMDKGGQDFAEMFYNPEAYNIMPFYNIWDKESENSTCGFFHPAYINLVGYYDENGNSDIEGAKAYLMRRRKKLIDTKASSKKIVSEQQEYPFSPSEAFLTSSEGMFTPGLVEQLEKVVKNNLQFKKGTTVELSYKDGKIIVKPDLVGKLKPIIKWKHKEKDKTGAVIIYEMPVVNPPRGLYKIVYDPTRQNKSEYSTSLNAIYVYKGKYKGPGLSNAIVAEYVGRPNTVDDANRIALYLAMLYNAEVLHENEVTHVINFFKRQKALKYLAVEPRNAIEKTVKESKVRRNFGIHINDKLKQDGIEYLKQWFEEVDDYDKEGNPIFRYEKIYSQGLLEEAINFKNDKRLNFDRISAMILLMFALQEEDLEKEYTDKYLEAEEKFKKQVESFFKMQSKKYVI